MNGSNPGDALASEHPESSDVFTIDGVRALGTRLPTPMRYPAVDHPSPKRAAILVPIVATEAGAAVVVTKRSTTMRSHSDDWVFPGGRVEDGDESPAEAARRETAEELGIDASRIEVVGQLDSHGPIITGYLIDVFVGIVHPSGTGNAIVGGHMSDGLGGPAVAFDHDLGEVAEVFVVPLGELADATRSFWAPIDQATNSAAAIDSSGGALLRWYRVRDDAHLWGMQGNIVFNLLDGLTGGRHLTGGVAGEDRRLPR